MARHQVVNESEFNMWRAVFAFALADNFLSLEEQELLKAYQSQVNFSQKQIDILRDDFRKPQDVVMMYNKITDPEHKTRFCALARALVWCEGDMDRQEEEILRKMSCFELAEYKEALHQSRSHPDLQSYYREYSKAGMTGLFTNAHTFEMRV